MEWKNFGHQIFALVGHISCQLQQSSNSYTIHVQNLQKLMTEIYKSLNNMNPSVALEFHTKKYVKYDLGKKNLCKLHKQVQYMK